MHCPYCGAALRQGSTFCQTCGAAAQTVPSIDQMIAEDPGSYQNYCSTDELGYLAKDQWPMDDIPITLPKRIPTGGRRNKPSLALRVPLQLFSFLLSIVLLVCLLGTALLMDCNRMLSAAGIKQVMNAIFSVSQSKPVVSVISGAVGASPRMDHATTLPPTVSIPENGLSNIELPADVLTSGDAEALVDWLCGMAQEIAGENMVINRQQVQTFVEDSTLTDYLAEKAAGYAADFINGTTDTQITTGELMQLLEDNEKLIENTFQVEFSAEMKQQLKTAITTTIEENNLNEMIHQQVFTAIEETLDASLPIEWATLQSILQTLTSDSLMLGAIGLCVLIILLLCVLNFYNVPAGITWSAVSCILAGCLLSLPVAILQASPALLTELLGIPGGIVRLLLSFLSAFSPVHYGMLIFGVVLLVFSILWRILRATSRPVFS